MKMAVSFRQIPGHDLSKFDRDFDPKNAVSKRVPGCLGSFKWPTPYKAELAASNELC